MIFNSYDNTIPKTTAITEKTMERIMVFLNPYPSNKEDTFGIINSDDTINTPINLIEITIATVANTINKMFNKTTLTPLTLACSSSNTRYTSLL